MEAILHKGLLNKYFSICNLRLTRETQISGFFLKLGLQICETKI